MAVIGAVFGELVGSDAGLGHAIQVGTAQLLTARVFAAVLILSAMAIALFALVAVARAAAVPWACADRRAAHEARRRPRCAAGPRAAAGARPACGEKSESVERTACQVTGLDLALDWFPNPDHVAIYEAHRRGLLPRGRAGREAARALGPGGADQAGRRRPRRPGDLLRAGGACSRASRACRWWRVAALVQRPLTSLIATGKSGRPLGRDLRGKRVGHGRHPLPVGLPEDDPAARATCRSPR